MEMTDSQVITAFEQKRRLESSSWGVRLAERDLAAAKIGLELAQGHYDETHAQLVSMMSEMTDEQLAELIQAELEDDFLKAPTEGPFHIPTNGPIAVLVNGVLTWK